MWHDVKIAFDGSMSSLPRDLKNQFSEKSHYIDEFITAILKSYKISQNK